MNRTSVIPLLFAGLALSCVNVSAQSPAVTVDPQRHGNLAAAQQSVSQAWAQITEAQHENNNHLGGHAEKAKDLLTQANDEIRAAADTANGSVGQGPSSFTSGAPLSNAPLTSSGPPPSAPDLSGNWTIYAYNTNQPGSSLKMAQLTQNGNILSGTFHGPHQHGKLQGWIQGNHVEFSTDTHDVLTFRGEITASGMSGLYGIHGQHAPWKAERTQ